ncbi:DUF1990 family protein [Pseudonocardia sp. Ae168_Ps1]|uniref:DUF1990 family protein n=1 Tax=unclassified Pseudonocardia TaxID=2619320 RepID=UPI00352AF737
MRSLIPSPILARAYGGACQEELNYSRSDLENVASQSRNFTHTAKLGSGSARFQHASMSLKNWEMHSRAGIAVYAPSGAPAVDATVILAIGVAPISITAPCRVVHCWDYSRSYGFTYGTLGSHPECGEETFQVDLDSNESVTLQISGISTPRYSILRIFRSVQDCAQDVITRKYARSMRSICAEKMPK